MPRPKCVYRMAGQDLGEREPQSKYGRVPLPPNTVSPRWRFAAIVLAVLLAVVAVLPFALTYQSTSTETRVQWRQYSIPGGPSSQNSTFVAPGTFCPRPTPVGPIVFALNWSSSGGVPIIHVRVWTVLATNSPPGWEPDLLYTSNSGTSGFGTFNPVPYCGQSWTVDDNATATTIVTVTMALAYNYTATSTEHWLP